MVTFVPGSRLCLHILYEKCCIQTNAHWNKSFLRFLNGLRVVIIYIFTFTCILMYSSLLDCMYVCVCSSVWARVCVREPFVLLHNFQLN